MVYKESIKSAKKTTESWYLLLNFMTISKTFFRTINHFHTKTKLRLTYEQQKEK